MILNSFTKFISLLFESCLSEYWNKFQWKNHSKNSNSFLNSCLSIIQYEVKYRIYFTVIECNPWRCSSSCTRFSINLSWESVMRRRLRSHGSYSFINPMCRHTTLGMSTLSSVTWSRRLSCVETSRYSFISWRTAWTSLFKKSAA